MVKKVVKRSLIKYKFTLLAINTIFLIAVILSVITVYALTYGLSNYQEYQEQTNMEDFNTQVIQKLSSETEQKIEDEYDVNLEYDPVIINNFKVGSEEHQVQIDIYQNDDKITKPIITSGSAPSNNQEILLSQEYASANEIKVGDTIELDGNEYQVSGLASYPYLMFPIKDDSIIPDNKLVARASVNKSAFNNDFDQNDVTYQYQGKFNEELSLSERESIYEEMQKDVTIKVPTTNIVGVNETNMQKASNFITIQDTTKNFKLNALELEYQYMGIIIGGLATIIIIITILLAIFLFKNIVENQRRELGILIAEGVSTTELALGYQNYFGKILVITGILGLALGVLSAIGLETLFEQFFNIIKYPINIWILIAIPLVVITLVIVVITMVHVFAIKININKPVLNLIANVESKDNKKVKKYQITDKLKFKYKMPIKTLLRNKTKTLLLIYGVAFATFLLVFGLTMISGILNLEENIKGDNFTYDYTVVYSPTFEVDPQLNDQNTTINFQAEISSVNQSEIVSDPVEILGYDNENKYIDFGSELDGEELFISESLASKYKLETNDQITISNLTNSNETYQFKVKEIVDVKHEEKIYANKSYLQQEIGLDNNFYNGLVGSGESRKVATQGDEKAYYYSVDDLVANMNSYNAIMNFAIIYITVLASILAFITMMVIANITIRANKKTISFMKVLGYQNKEIQRLILNGYKYIVIIATVVLYPLAIIGVQIYFDFIMGLVEGLNYPIYIESKWYFILIIIVIIFGIYLIVSKITTDKINKIKLSKSLNKDE